MTRKILILSFLLSFEAYVMAQSSEPSDFKIPELTTYYLCILEKGPNWTDADTPEHRQLQQRHLRHILKLTKQGSIVIAGPFEDGDHERGIAVYRTASLEEAKGLGAADPKVKAGHLTLRWLTWSAPKGVLPEPNLLNKSDAGRQLEFTTTVDMSVAKVFQLWSTREGVKKFFAREAKIDTYVGGRYEIIFDPENDPQGKVTGTFGAKTLEIENNKMLAFEWTMPPFVAELNTDPLPTWIEVKLHPVEGQNDQTRVSIAHKGFGSGKKWDQAFKWFGESAWPAVIDRLEQYCNEKSNPWVVIGSN